ncbi:hypothetical protein RND71_003418 [Anisodus tanguticus]|uniref:Uncharacterized protein n=1 Tax=Anisodus tanguticus TaxID=243964 RepID=A0AAE1VPY9_9SOLA|nr:hypothetical protein RND71_003418 [Anisodus tanguticus]
MPRESPCDRKEVADGVASRSPIDPSKTVVPSQMEKLGKRYHAEIQRDWYIKGSNPGIILDVRSVTTGNGNKFGVCMKRYIDNAIIIFPSLSLVIPPVPHTTIDTPGNTPRRSIFLWTDTTIDTSDYTPRSLESYMQHDYFKQFTNQDRHNTLARRLTEYSTKYKSHGLTDTFPKRTNHKLNFLLDIRSDVCFNYATLISSVMGDSLKELLKFITSSNGFMRKMMTTTIQELAETPTTSSSVQVSFNDKKKGKDEILGEFQENFIKSEIIAMLLQRIP